MILSALVVSGSDDNSIRLWESSTGKEVWRAEGHDDWIQSIAFSPDGTLVVSGSDDKTIRIWETTSGRELRYMKGHEGGIFSVVFSPDGAFVASGSSDNTVRLWEVSTGLELRCWEGHDDWVVCVAFSPDGSLVVSGSNDNTLRFWRKESSDYIAAFAHAPDGWVTYASDGRYKFGGDVGGHFWHAINLCRFEVGELDPFWPTQLHMIDDESLFK